jgi:hypothetical protein
MTADNCHKMLPGLVLASFQLGSHAVWAFEPKKDTFSSSAVVDLRSLNEGVAGEHGYIKVSPDGDFVRGDNQPIRFWAVNTGVGREEPFVARPRWSQQAPNLDQHARFLAKRGVNLVRFHAQVAPSEKQRIDEINDSERRWIWRSLAAMKKQGIYSCVSPYWMVPTKIPAHWGVPGGAQGADGLLFFDKTLQNAYKGWLKKLLLEPNPHTGIPLAKDPAMAIFQIQNEDSLLFWTVNNLKGTQRENLKKQYTDWLLRKYGNQNAIAKAWEGNRLGTDGATYDFHNIWEMTQQRTGGMSVRLGDQLEFWSRTMYNWNAEVKRFLREDLGCKALVNAGNWKTADSVRLNDAERWSYTACDVDAVNHYIGGIHKGPNEGWSVDRGDFYNSVSCLVNPELLPTNIRQTQGRPMMVTESMWVMPNAYAAEAPFLVSALSSLNGLDAYFWFATNDEQWTPPQSANGYNDGQQKWMYGSPDVLGMFPGAAYMFRKGLVSKSPSALVETRALRDVFARRTPLIAEVPTFDPNRDAGDVAPTSNIKTGFKPEIFLRGPVEVAYSTEGQSSAKTISQAFLLPIQFMNHGSSALGSSCVLATPQAQGAAFLASSKMLESGFSFGDLECTTRNIFGSLLAVSMDDQPIKTSKKIFIQFGTQARPTGWKEEATKTKLGDGREVEGFRILETGKAPWLMVKPSLSVLVKNMAVKRVTMLDENMVPVRDVDVTKAANGIRFEFPSGALYVILQP